MAPLSPSSTGAGFALRREVEVPLAGTTPPNLLVYVSTSAPDPDPLEELRAVGASYRSLLPTVICVSLRGQLTDRRLEELGKQCQTLAEVEAALDAGASEADARLMTLVSESGTSAIARALLSGSYDEQLSDPSLLDAAQTFFSQATGVTTNAADGAALRSEIFRHFVLTAIQDATGRSPTRSPDPLRHRRRHSARPSTTLGASFEQRPKPRPQSSSSPTRLTVCCTPRPS